jgi:hypothetical protein
MMSSDSSTEAPTIRAWQFFLIGALLCATVAVLLATDTSPGNLVLTSLAIAGAGGVGALTFRVIQPFAASEAVTGPDSSLRGRARVAIEREKALVLRSIKELEFDRAMGKVGESDFDEMMARLRSRAVGLLRQLDEREAAHYRASIERDVVARLNQRRPTARAARPAVAGVAPRTCSRCGTVTGADDAFCAECGVRLKCATCGADTEAEARFCKQCGTRLSEGSA